MMSAWASRFAAWLDLAGYALVPLVVVGPVLCLPMELADPGRTGAEWAMVVAAWALVLLLSTARVLAGQAPLPLRGGVAPWLLGLGAWVLVAAPLARHPELHLRLALTVVPALLAVLLLASWLAQSERRRGWLLGWLGAVLVLELGLAVAEAARWAPPALSFVEGLQAAASEAARSGAVRGSLETPSFLGELLALLGPVWLGFVATWRAWPARLAGFAVALAALWGLLAAVACGAAAGLAAAAGAAFAAWGWRLRSASRPGREAVVAAAVAAVVALVSAGALADELRSGWPAQAWALRLELWGAAWHAWLASPLWGVGLGGFAADAPVWLLAGSPEGPSAAASASLWFEAHNEPLQLAAELGLVGVGLAVMAAWGWLRALGRATSQPLALRLGLATGAFALLVAALGAAPLHVPVIAWALAAVAALGASLDPTFQDAEPQGVPGGLAWGVVHLVAWSALAVVALARGVGAEWVASQQMELARRLLVRHPHAVSIPRLQAAAAEHTRFKAIVVPRTMRHLIRHKEYSGALAVYARYAGDGVGVEAEFQRGFALLQLGRLLEAGTAFHRVAAYHHPDTRLHQRAATRLESLGLADPRPRPRSDGPSVATPVPSVAPTP
jgi:O-antigen ligase